MYFDAVMPVIVDRPGCGAGITCSRLLGGSSGSPIGYEESGLSVDSRVWKLLLNIDAKLDLILDRLALRSEGLEQALAQRVILDDSLITVGWPENLGVGDSVRIRMWLPMRRVTGVMIGAVVEMATPDHGGGFVLSCRLTDVSDEVANKFIEYAIDRQREEINKRKSDSV